MLPASMYLVYSRQMPRILLNNVEYGVNSKCCQVDYFGIKGHILGLMTNVIILVTIKWRKAHKLWSTQRDLAAKPSWLSNLLQLIKLLMGKLTPYGKRAVTWYWLRKLRRRWFRFCWCSFCWRTFTLINSSRRP